MVLAEETRLQVRANLSSQTVTKKLISIQQLLTLTRPALVNARLELAKAGGTTLIWNYLPIETAKLALSKLSHARKKCKFFFCAAMLFTVGIAC
jgi:hypothetical protein